MSLISFFLLISDYTYRDSKVSAHIGGRKDQVVFQLGVSVQRLLLAIGEYVSAMAVVTNDVLLRFTGDLDVARIVHVIVSQAQVSVQLLSDYKSQLLQLEKNRKHRTQSLSIMINKFIAWKNEGYYPTIR